MPYHNPDLSLRSSITQIMNGVVSLKDRVRRRLEQRDIWTPEHVQALEALYKRLGDIEVEILAMNSPDYW